MQLTFRTKIQGQISNQSKDIMVCTFIGAISIITCKLRLSLALNTSPIKQCTLFQINNVQNVWDSITILSSIILLSLFYIYRLMHTLGGI